MKKETWRGKIRKACTEAGTYRPFFDPVIDTLAAILEKRDEVEKAYREGGEGPIVTYINKAGAANKTKNPAIVLWDDLNKSAVLYWRDLGLTPAGLKKIDESAMAKKKRSGLAEALESLGG